MADAADSKSAVRKGVRVQVPPSALEFDSYRVELTAREVVGGEQDESCCPSDLH